jgi:cyclopropane-fatty-acyl-phospholipid synthase
VASQSDISYHYDVDNDFFALFLDKEFMAYSCGVWKNAQDLEQAQKQKINRISSFARVSADSRVIDVGCGWGGLLQHVVVGLGVTDAVGLTLSTDQYTHITRTAHKSVKVELRSWADFPVGGAKFNAVMSVGAFEHFASLEDRKLDRHGEIYRQFFQWCRDVSTDKAHVGLQTIISARPPNNLGEVKDARFLLEDVFKGSALPTFEDISQSIRGLYEFVDLRRIGHDYARTLKEWKSRLVESEELILRDYNAQLFEHYCRYFDAAERGFTSGMVDLLQVSLRPISPASRKRPTPRAH